MSNRYEHVIKYLKFLTYWNESSSFLATVENCSKTKAGGNPMWFFHTKLKRLSTTLGVWSRNEFGNIFTKIIEYEDSVKDVENNLLDSNNKDNRDKLN